MTPKKIKPVKAWALAFDGLISPAWVYSTKSNLSGDWHDRRAGERIVRVEIRPVAPKRKRKVKK